MLLSTLIEELKGQFSSLAYYPSTVPSVDLKNLTLDSRQANKFTLFIALNGTHLNGEDFIPNAIQQGTKVIATSLEAAQKNAALYPEIFFIGIKEIRPFVSKASALFHPKQPETIVAVTGTNGKTSTVDFTRYLWECCGRKSASLGTLGVQSKFFQNEKHLTTPEAPYLHTLLDDLQAHGITHVAMEASSHGIDQHRLDSVHLKAAGFTNLSPEHLDYHATMDAYLKAKLQLFERILPPTSTCVLNADIPEYKTIIDAVGKRPILSYGYQGEDIQIISLTPKEQGQEAVLKVFGKTISLNFPLIGSFQFYNALCALGLVVACDPAHLEKALQGLQTVPAIPGRLEYIGSTPNGADVYIDYAHTPDGLENLLNALRPHTKNHLHVVFGGGGDRDPSTREPRGRLAKNLADAVYITDDNPRFEDPHSIRKQLIKGCPSAKEIPDRAQAIQTAIQALNAGDSLVIAGKGREQGQDIKGAVIPFDDAQTILTTLQEIS